jgi:pyruvate kinase
MRRHRSIKIVATLGPASSDYETIRKLFEAGADVFRLNMSHGTQDQIKSRHQMIRKVEKDLKTPIAILADLQGPKLRVGAFQDLEETLDIGASFRLDLLQDLGDKDRVQFPHKEIFQVLDVGSTILINDGKIRLEVLRCGLDFAECLVLVGGVISNNKGVNLPDVVLPVKALSEKDKNDLEFICNLGVDWLALSFVQRPEDVQEASVLVKNRAAIMSKIEKPAAVERFDSILEISDGIMIARGDLGVEMPVHKIPPIQKKLIRKCREFAKPVIVATQMLESMIKSPIPTRAEVSDVATAIYEGADAIMLSAESAAGDFPVEAVQTMNDIAIEVENDSNHRKILAAQRVGNKQSVADAIVSAAREIAETTAVKAICCFSQSGTTALLVSRERPHVPIIAMTALVSTARRLCLTWGTHSVLTDELERFKMAVINASRAAIKYQFATQKDYIVVTAGVPFNIPGSTNILRVAPCDERLIFSSEPN